MHVPGNSGFVSRALLSPVYVVKSEYLRECSASRVWPYMHQLRIMSLVNSWVCPAPMFCYLPLYRLRWHQENCCDCALVHLDEHLSRESRKLTVMIKRETGQPLDDLAESSVFLCINEGPFLGHVRTRTVFGRARRYQGLYSSPTVKLLWLSESVKAL